MLKKSSVSVIIPTYNDATYAERLLEALVRQNYSNFEVIVSDADSNDGIDSIVEKFKENLKISLVISKPLGPSHGRNIGAKKAKGEWLLFLDADDDIDDPDFIKTMVETAETNKWQTASAKINASRGTAKERIGMGLNYRYIKLLAKTKHPVAPGWCILTKRKVFEKHLGFNENIKFGEDYDYVSRVGERGFGFVDQTYYYVDFRRARSEGWRLTFKAIGNEIYRHTHRYNLEKNPFKYEFGKHKEREK